MIAVPRAHPSSHGCTVSRRSCSYQSLFISYIFSLELGPLEIVR